MRTLHRRCLPAVHTIPNQPTKATPEYNRSKKINLTIARPAGCARFSGCEKIKTKRKLSVKEVYKHRGEQVKVKKTAARLEIVSVGVVRFSRTRIRHNTVTPSTPPLCVQPHHVHAQYSSAVHAGPVLLCTFCHARRERYIRMCLLTFLALSATRRLGLCDD